MTIQDFLALGNKYQAENNFPMAIAVWNEALKIDPNCAAIHVNIADAHRRQNQPQAELQKLLHVWNWCPFPPALEEMKAQIKARIDELQGKKTG